MIARSPWGGLATPAVPSPRVAILGVPWDGSACWRQGAAEAPRRLREISHTSPAISEEGHVVEAGGFPVVDLGDVAPPGGLRRDEPGFEPAVAEYFRRIEEAVVSALDRRGDSRPPFLLALGGDHSVTIPLFTGFSRAVEGPLGLVLLDAHPDLFDVYEGSRLSNACPLRRALETGRLAPEHVLIAGTRSYNVGELDFMRERRIRFLPAREVDRRGISAVVALARERLAHLPAVYLTVDIDVAAPSCAPGTGTPVAGGLTSRQTLDLVRGLVEALPVRAMDLVEIAPALDPTGATLFLGLQLVFEVFACLDRRE